MNQFLKVLLMVSILVSGASFADSIDVSKLQGLGDTRYQPFESKQLGHPLYLYVRLPIVTEENKDQLFPTVYLLDGGLNFPLLGAYYHYLRIGEELPEMILVGISYGSDTFEGGNYRSSDFTAPAADRDWWGKASIFQAVLKDELIPLIESAYPADPEQRVIYGQSLGGQFVLYTALTQPELFHGHLSSNPALHRNLSFFLSWQGTTPMPTTDSRLFVSLAEFDDSRFRIPADQWADTWRGKDPRPWKLKIQDLEDQNHLSAGPMAFRRGMKWLLDLEDD